MDYKKWSILELGEVNDLGIAKSPERAH